MQSVNIVKESKLVKQNKVEKKLKVKKKKIYSEIFLHLRVLFVEINY